MSFTSLVKFNFKNLQPDRQVHHLSYDLTVDAQRFFYDSIAPRLSSVNTDLQSAQNHYPSSWTSKDFRDLGDILLVEIKLK